MVAMNFIFNGVSSESYKVIICTFDNSSGNTLASGGEVEFVTSKAPRGDKFNYHGCKYDIPLKWNFAIAKNPETSDSQYFTYDEEREVASWLMADDGYHWLQFEVDYNIFYKVYFNITPYQIGGQTAGFEVEVISNCAYGFSEEQTRKFTLNSATPYEFNLQHDRRSYIYPYIEIVGKGNEINIKNESDLQQVATTIKKLSSVTFDGENKIVTGVIPDDFNWRFLRLKDGKNIITTNSANDLEIVLKFRTARRVVI